MAILSDSKARWLANSDTLDFHLSVSGSVKECDVVIEIYELSGPVLCTLNERHYVKDGVVSINDLSLLLKPYFERFADFIPDMTPGRHEINPTLYVDFVFKVNAMTVDDYSYRFAYSDIIMPTKYVNSWEVGAVYNRFLTRSGKYDLPSSCKAAVATYSALAIEIYVLYSAAESVERLLVKTYPASDGLDLMTIVMFDWDFIYELLQQVRPAVEYERLLGVEISISKNDLLPKADTVVYYRDTRYHYNIRSFLFEGSMGEPVILNFTGKEEMMPEMNAEFVTAGNCFVKVRDGYAKMRKSYSGPLNEATRNLVHDLANSRHVFVLENNKWERATITDVDLHEEVPHLEPIGLMVTWRLSNNKKQRTYSYE